MYKGVFLYFLRKDVITFIIIASPFILAYRSAKIQSEIIKVSQEVISSRPNNTAESSAINYVISLYDSYQEFINSIISLSKKNYPQVYISLKDNKLININYSYILLTSTSMYLILYNKQDNSILALLRSEVPIIKVDVTKE
jgi:hypothetical protein